MESIAVMQFKSKTDLKLEPSVCRMAGDPPLQAYVATISSVCQSLWKLEVFGKAGSPKCSPTWLNK